jgi:hypothetical protein
MYDYVLFVIIMIQAHVQDPYIISHLSFVTSHCHSAVYVGGWLSCVHVYDKYGDRKQQLIVVRLNNNPIQYNVEGM